MRYFIALAAAMLLIACGALYVVLTPRSFDEHVRKLLRHEKQKGTLPADLQDIDIESVSVQNSGEQVPLGLEVRIEVARLLSEYWYVWILLAIASSLRVAALTGKWRAVAEPGAAGDRGNG